MLCLIFIKCEIESSSFAGFGLRPYSTLVAIHYFLTDSKSNAGARKLFASIQSPEDFKDLL